MRGQLETEDSKQSYVEPWIFPDNKVVQKLQEIGSHYTRYRLRAVVVIGGVVTDGLVAGAAVVTGLVVGGGVVVVGSGTLHSTATSS